MHAFLFFQSLGSAQLLQLDLAASVARLADGQVTYDCLRMFNVENSKLDGSVIIEASQCVRFVIIGPREALLKISGVYHIGPTLTHELYMPTICRFEGYHQYVTMLLFNR